MENVGKVQYHDGFVWTNLATYDLGTQYHNGVFNSFSVSMSETSYTFTDNMKFKFVSVPSEGTGDDYILMQ